MKMNQIPYSFLIFGIFDIMVGELPFMEWGYDFIRSGYQLGNKTLQDVVCHW